MWDKIFKRKKYFLFTYGSYFWGFENTLIKAKNEAEAVEKFLQPSIQTKPLEKWYNSNGTEIRTIKDVISKHSYKVKEIEVSK